MAKVVVGAEVKVEGLEKAGTSVGTLKKQLKEANNELLTMSQKFGDTSKEAAAAAQKVAKLKDSIGDAKALADTFNPDKKFVALGGALQGAVSGFSALTGTLGLFGVKGQEIEQVLLKVQSAMALQQGISGIMGAVDSFKLLKTAILNSTIVQKANNAATAAATLIQRAFGVSVVGTGTAFKLLRAAIIATGIGALIVLIGTIVSKLDLFASKTKTAAEAQEELAEAANKVNDAMSQQTEFLDSLTEIEIKRARIAGATEEQISALTIKGIKKRIDARNREVERLRATGISTHELLEANSRDIDLITNLTLDNQIKAADKWRAKNEEINNRIAAANKQRADEAKKQAEETNRNFLLGQLDRVNKEIEQEQIAFENEQEEKEQKRLAREEELALEKEHAEKSLKIQADAAEVSKIIQQKLIDDKKKKQELTLELLDNLATVVGKQTAAGKALAIAQAVINTYQGASDALKANYGLLGPFAQIARFAAVAATIKRGFETVKAITAVKIPGSGGGSASVPSIGNISAPLQPRQSTTLLDQGQVNQIGNAAARAYVLEHDVANNAERIRRINRAARLN